MFGRFRKIGKKRIPRSIVFEEDPNMPVYNAGAPCPMIIADESNLVVAFYLDRPMPEFDGTNPKSMGLRTENEPCAALIFEFPSDFRFGPPDSMKGYKLAEYFPIFKPWTAFVTNMRNWVSDVLESDAQVEPLRYGDLNHYVIAFHDTTLEVIARGYRVERDTCSVHEMISRQHAALA